MGQRALQAVMTKEEGRISGQQAPQEATKVQKGDVQEGQRGKHSVDSKPQLKDFT